MSSRSGHKSKKKKGPRYSATCRCGHEMKVKTKHFGRMCRCTQCNFPIYVTYDNVTPPVDPKDKLIPNFYCEDEVPVRWEVGDLITELYAVKEILGEGGMGTVYRVEHRDWGKMLAVKCPSGHLMNDPLWVEQFEHECETWINLLPHPNVVECFYMRRFGGLPRLFVEFLDGPDLDNMISEKTLYEGGQDGVLRRMLDIGIQYCRGLHHAHQEGLVHQDVKPSNLLVGSDGVAKVTDFGLAMVFGESGGSRASRGSRGSSGGSGMDGGRLRGSTGGTPTYRSNDHKAYSELTLHADVWSWGVTMIEMFSGDVYWTDGRKAMSVLENLLRHGSRYDVIPKMPLKLQSLLRRCFQEDRLKRPGDMTVLADRLKEVYSDELGEEYPRAEPELNYTQVDVLNNRAVSLIDLGQPGEAEALLQEVLIEHPEHIQASYNRGLLFWRRGHITDTQMLELTQNMCHTYPQEWLPRYLTAEVCMERGDCGIAMDILEPIVNDDEYRRDVAFCQAMSYHYQTRDKKRVWESRMEGIQVSAVGVSVDGWRILTGGVDGKIVSFERASQEATTTFVGHEGGIRSLAFSNDETFIASASVDGTVRLWAPVKGNCIHVLSGHQGAVQRAVISANGRFVLSGGEDAVVRYWDVQSGQCMRTFAGHGGPIWDVAISRCGRFAFSASTDGTVIQWDIGSGKRIRG
ncbi:MAG: protein kinase, partial [Candidatus Hydrogenedentota bacterium]